METALPKDIPVILASASPRRKELLGEMGISFQVLTCDTDESYPPTMHPKEAVTYLSQKKAEAVRAIAPPNAIIIASDTMVEVDGIPFGKPENQADAARMLQTLSGRHHNVHTGVCVLWGEQTLLGVDSTDVCFHPLSDEDIVWYIGTGEPMDKAGAYGIQGKGGQLVSHINGHMDTVIGLPCELVDTLLGEIVFS